MVTLQLCGWKLLHTKKLGSILYLIDIEFYFFKPKKTLFELPFWGLRVNVRTPSIARSRLFVIIELFSLSFTAETLYAETCRSWRFPKWFGHFERKFQTEGRAHQPLLDLLVSRNTAGWLSFRVVSKYPQCIVLFCHKARVWRTDRRTDRITTANTALV